MKRFTFFMALLCLAIPQFIQAQLTLLDDIQENGSSIFNQKRNFYASTEDNLFFRADDGALGNELFVTDGTALGTLLVQDINQGASASDPAQLTAWNNLVFFVADDGIHGQELWVSDGTSLGTKMVKDFFSNGNGLSTSFSRFIAMEDAIYFEAYTDESGDELWKSDGTAEGTVMVEELTNGSSGSFITMLGALDGHLIFATKNDIGNGIFSYSPLSEEFTQLLDLSSFNTNIQYDRVYVGENAIACILGSAVFGAQIIYSDGTAEGTDFISDDEYDRIGDFIMYNNDLYFSGNLGTQNSVLWKYSPTVGSIELVKDFDDFSGRTPIEFTIFQEELFFYAFDTQDGLWKTDGTTEGTTHIYKFLGNTGGAREIISMGDRLLLTAADNSFLGFELFESFGTQTSTTLAEDILEGSSSSSPSNFLKFKDGLFFTANGDLGAEPYFYVPQNPVLMTGMINIEQEILCFDDATGALSVSLNNATEPIEYDWSVTGVEGANPENLSMGTYIVTITDATDQTLILSTLLLQPDQLIVTADITDSPEMSMDGIISISVEGGTGMYTIEWDDFPSNENFILENLAAGVYTGKITDENFCETDFEFEIGTLVSTLNEDKFEVSIYPNITRDFIHLETQDKDLEFCIVSVTGEILFDWQITKDRTIDVSMLRSGTYLMLFRSANFLTERKFIVID